MKTATYETLADSIIELARVEPVTFTNSGTSIRGGFECNDFLRYQIKTSVIVRDDEALAELSLKDILRIKMEHIVGSNIAKLEFDIGEHASHHITDAYVSFFYEKVEPILANNKN